MLEITPITRIVVSIDVAGLLANEAPAVIAGVGVAFVEPGAAPVGTTAWMASTYSGGTAYVMVAGYDADPVDALVCPPGNGANLWILVTDAVTGEVIPKMVMRVEAKRGPSGAETVVSGTPFVQSVAGLTGIISGPALVTALGGTGGGGTVADATTTTKGKVQLAGDLAGTADAPTVPGLAAKANTSSLAPVATSGVYADLTAKPTIPTVGAAGAGTGVALSSTDASVTNARTPSTHAATHASGGSDPVTIASTQVTGLGTAATQPTTAFDASGAASAAQATAVQRANHTGTQSADTLTDGTTNKAYLATERTGLTRLQAATDFTGTLRGAWAGNVAYAVGDVVTAESGLFRTATAHTSNAAGFKYDRNFWETIPIPVLAPGTSVPIRQVDQTNIGAGISTPRAGLFQRPQKMFNYLSERVIWAWKATTDLTISGTSVTGANGTMPGGSVVLTRATGTGPMQATSQVLATPINLSGNGEHLRIPARITTAASSAYLNIYLSSGGAAFTNSLKLSVIVADPPPYGWRTYAVPLSETAVQGTGADLTAINAIRIEYDSGAAGDKIEVSRVTRHPNVAAKAKVILWFDDGNLTNQSAAIDVATRLGLPVTLAHIGDTYTAAGTTITAEKARYLQDYTGSQVAVHAFGAVDHDRPQDGPTLLEQMLDYQHFGLALGFKGIEDAAYYNTGFPGVLTAEMELVARKLFRSARATGAYFPDTLPPGDPLRTRAFMPPGSSTFTGWYQPLINRAITYKGLVQFVWHAMNATDLTEFTNLCTWLDANRATVDTTTPTRAFDPLCT